MCSKKDYIAIAAIIREQATLSEAGYTATAGVAVRLTAHNIADYFSRTYPAFQRAKFLAACAAEATQ